MGVAKGTTYPIYPQYIVSNRTIHTIYCIDRDYLRVFVTTFSPEYKYASHKKLLTAVLPIFYISIVFFSKYAIYKKGLYNEFGIEAGRFRRRDFTSNVVFRRGAGYGNGTAHERLHFRGLVWGVNVYKR